MNARQLLHILQARDLLGVACDEGGDGEGVWGSTTTSELPSAEVLYSELFALQSAPRGEAAKGPTESNVVVELCWSCCTGL